MTSSPSRTFHPTYPTPGVSSDDWKSLRDMFRGMAEAPQMRANELTRSPELRAAAQATADAYLFAALMVDNTFGRFKGIKPQPTTSPSSQP